MKDTKCLRVFKDQMEGVCTYVGWIQGSAVRAVLLKNKFSVLTGGGGVKFHQRKKRMNRLMKEKRDFFS